MIGAISARHAEILNPEALAFLGELHRTVDAQRKALLAEPTPGAAAALAGLARVPVMFDERALLADFEDIERPRFADIMDGFIALNELAGNAEAGLPLVRPRAWHRLESHVRVDGAPIAASVFDVGLALFYSARSLVQRGALPVFYLPVIERKREAGLWNALFVRAQELLGLPPRTISIAVEIAALPSTAVAVIVRELGICSRVVALPAGNWEAASDVFFKTFGRAPSA